MSDDPKDLVRRCRLRDKEHEAAITWQPGESAASYLERLRAHGATVTEVAQALREEATQRPLLPKSRKRRYGDPHR